MVQRVLIQGGAQAAMRVSKPGYDVNTASLDNMVFDSRFANLEVVKKGVVSVPATTWSGGFTYYDYGFSLPAPPLGLFNFGFYPPSNVEGGEFRGNSPLLTKTFISNDFVPETASFFLAILGTSGFYLKSVYDWTVYYTLFRRISA